MAFDVSMVRSQIGIGGDWVTQVLWFVALMVLIFFQPRLMLAQTMWKLEQSAETIEGYGKKAKNIVLKKIAKKPTARQKEDVNNFLEFFSIAPVNLDPFGIVKKIEHVMDLEEERFKYFVDNVAPRANAEEKQNILMGMSGAVSLNEVGKIVRHYVETIRKTKNLQLAMVVQMQLPMLEKLSKALLGGTEAFSEGWPIGDSVGPLIAAHMAGDSKMADIEKEVVSAVKTIRGRKVFVMKAKGPGGRLGRLGKAVEKVAKANKIAKIITVDAAAKLEGEKTGRLAEGVGVAIGGIGVDRSYIEDLAVKKRIPIDSIVVKMADEEAIQPIKQDVLRAVPMAIKAVEERIAVTKGAGSIIVVGVGNSSGIGNNKAEAIKAEVLARRVLQIMKVRETHQKEEDKKNRWKNFFMGG
jgi:hypothetical protein